ncbi:hypothetical protein [Allocoleopsis franciscana]|uniref:Low temperature-induced protein n=1 Tax=Allocoleopsis franciscana PCC 7113 TaxID=1173027 RepID=K9WPF4_9CYAN|nr:hypothetical protein [Allocoleopsis franciscana]AFZ21432.1 hypothetical protein Mic7113_5812 [Allocoleopsis franciscana PCC 7113]
MTSIRLTLSALWRSLSIAVAAFACALILFSNVTPAYSLPNPFAQDKPTQAADPTSGEDQLLGIEEGAQKTAIRQGDQDLLSGEKVTQKSNEGGINEVQGAADIDKMKNPGNTRAESVEEIIGERLEEVTGQK